MGAGTQSIWGYNILTIEGILFGILTFGVVITLNVVGELYMGQGGAYNVDSVLDVMVMGLEEELKGRMKATITIRDTEDFDSGVSPSNDDVFRMNSISGDSSNDGQMPSPFALDRRKTYFQSYDSGEDDSEEVNRI